MVFLGCSDFVEVDPPKNTLISETVFKDPVTVESAFAHIYHSMREKGLVSGNAGLTTLMGIYSDELDYYGFDADFLQFYHHNIVADNTSITGWWSHAYNLIYSANNIIEGVAGSDVLRLEDRNKFHGQALFVRAYVHSLLVSLYGDIPYVTTTDYLVNNSVSRVPEAKVYENIIADLEESVDLLEGIEDISDERVLPDQWTVKALLARMYLYTEQWEAAEVISTQLLGAFALEPDLNEVFLKGSSETIWQLKPGENLRNTQEANQLIIQFIPGQTYALTDSLMESFEIGDQRSVHWTASISDTDNTVTLQFAHKYKALFNETESLEYSILFRLGEQHLIRAEARVYLGNLAEAQQDLNVIRNRAGLANTTANTVNDLLESILHERRVELFAEQGHRWFDLKRTGSATAVLGPVKSNWKATDILFPIPEIELESNPNLLPQNQGY
ncbi:RagB/SusD family nutrient uptake outer membrane protein [Flagellimonas algicola]|uniref:RagB/SusD family nutrient uptake outer membrane protein n=2 Tax=Flagellimonas algicola TaxID=2583815 RepID=A0ABY2WHH9_9FLAO|nr:RagB/SusD family nutrient uptake outer membrane protein [Allomuricauda algicola]